MIRNVYFKANCCGDTDVRYINDKFVEKCKNTLHCSCGRNLWVESSELCETSTTDIKTGKLVDHRAYDKTAYMSSDYLTKRSQINDFHREKTGFSKFKDN